MLSKVLIHLNQKLYDKFIITLENSSELVKEFINKYYIKKESFKGTFYDKYEEVPDKDEEKIKFINENDLNIYDLLVLEHYCKSYVSDYGKALIKKRRPLYRIFLKENGLRY